MSLKDRVGEFLVNTRQDKDGKPLPVDGIGEEIGDKAAMMKLMETVLDEPFVVTEVIEQTNFTELVQLVFVGTLRECLDWTDTAVAEDDDRTFCYCSEAEFLETEEVEWTEQ